MTLTAAASPVRAVARRGKSGRVSRRAKAAGVRRARAAAIVRNLASPLRSPAACGSMVLYSLDGLPQRDARVLAVCGAELSRGLPRAGGSGANSMAPARCGVARPLRFAWLLPSQAAPLVASGSEAA